MSNDTEYWLNEKQALLICMVAETPRAEEVRAAIIEVIVATRHGRRVPAMAMRVIDQLFDDHFPRH